MAVSPWQFKDLDDGNPEDSWVAYSDTLFADRWTDIVTGEFQPDIIEVLTWNDFCESHYIRDLPATVDTATDYVVFDNGMQSYTTADHAPWRIMAKYYIAWFKEGKAPEITMDQVVFWYRVHPKSTICLGGGSVRNADLPNDAVYAWALVQSEADITLTVGGNSATFKADGSGPVMQVVSFPAALTGSGVTPSVTIERDGDTVATATGTAAISTDCAWQNFNPVVNLAGDGINC